MNGVEVPGGVRIALVFEGAFIIRKVVAVEEGRGELEDGSPSRMMLPIANGASVDSGSNVCFSLDDIADSEGGKHRRACGNYSKGGPSWGGRRRSIEGRSLS